MSQPIRAIPYTGIEVEGAIAKALQLDSFAYQSTEEVEGLDLHILWKVRPSLETITYGIAVHPQTGELLKVESDKGNLSFTKYIDKVTENTVKLETTLYTYTNIGKISGASNTSPKKVASAGDTLKDVFNSVFGTQQDQQPTITTSSVALNVSAGTTSYGGGEYGTTVNATDVTITFTLANSGTAGYGYRCGDTKTTGSQTFYYPVVKQNNADIKITLPSEISTIEDTTVNNVAYKKLITSYNEKPITILTPTATYVTYSTKYLYCNLNNSTDKQVSIKVSLPEGNVTTESQTRYGQISASVTLGAAQKENQLTAGTAITRFLTYLKNDATETNKLSGGTKSNTAGEYTISAGSYYSYYKLTTSASAPTSGATKADRTDCDTTYNYSSGQYLWLLSRSSGKKIQTYVAGSWADVTTTSAGAITLTLASGGTATYYAYSTDKFTATGSARYRLA